MSRKTLLAEAGDPTVTAAIADVRAALAPLLAKLDTEASGRAFVFALLGVSGEWVLRLLSCYPSEAPALWAGYREILSRAFPSGNPTAPRGPAGPVH